MNAPPVSPQALKRYLHGTHRTCTPEETLERLRPLMPAMGITRVANVTGLDRTGIPVATACRPNSRSLATSQGKGLTLAAAKASAVMEAAELWHAERVMKPLKLASTLEMGDGHRIADVALLPRARDSRYAPDLPMLWVEGEDLFGGGALWVPFELVSANYTLPFPPGSGCFQTNTNGLASGNHWLEAVSHGLCEVVERDARTLWRHRPPGEAGRWLLDPDTIDDPACRELLARIASAGLEVRVWDITTDVGIASFVCALLGGDEGEVDPEFGSGCHPARHIALSRALTEAAQARNTFITAARDDYFSHLYESATRAARRASFLRLIEVSEAQRAYAEVPHFASGSLEDDLEWMLARLRGAGIEQAVAVDLTREAIGIAVARVIVPGLEGSMGHEGDDYAPGLRARRMLGLAA